MAEIGIYKLLEMQFPGIQFTSIMLKDLSICL